MWQLLHQKVFNVLKTLIRMRRLDASATPFPTCWPCAALAPTWAARRRRCSPCWRRQLIADELRIRKWPWFQFAAGDDAHRQPQPLSRFHQSNLNVTLFKKNLNRWKVLQIETVFNGEFGSLQPTKTIKMQFGELTIVQ